jgi:hypothetical protein
MAIDGTGNLYLTGGFANTVDFDPGPGTFNLSGPSGNSFISKIDGSGNFLWAKNIGGSSQTIGSGINVDPSGNIIACGGFSGSADLDPGPSSFIANTSGGFDIYIIKLNSAGNFSWAKTIGGISNDNPLKIITDAAGDIYSTGYFQDIVDFDSGPGTFTVGNSANQMDAYILKTDASGNFGWVVQFGSPGYDVGNCIAADAFGNIYSVGIFQGLIDADPGPVVYNMIPSGGQDGYIHKMGYCTSAPAMPSAINGTSVICSGSATLNLNYSVIQTGGTNYSWSLPGGWNGTSVTNSISVISGTSGVIGVTAINLCGSSTTQTLFISVDTIPNVNAITSNSLICTGQTVTLTASGAFSYLWMPGSISGNPVAISPTITTNYTVYGTSAGGCTDTVSLTQNVSACTPVIEKQFTNSLYVFPNPTYGEFTLEVTKECDAIILNMLGQKIMSLKLKKGKNSLSISEQDQGMYFIRVDETTFKMIKN